MSPSVWYVSERTRFTDERNQQKTKRRRHSQRAVNFMRPENLVEFKDILAVHVLGFAHNGVFTFPVKCLRNVDLTSAMLGLLFNACARTKLG